MARNIKRKVLAKTTNNDAKILYSFYSYELPNATSKTVSISNTTRDIGRKMADKVAKKLTLEL